MYIYDEKRNIWVPLRETRAYRLKRKRARDHWIAAGMVMIFLPLGAVIALLLLMTFLTLTFLDESAYHFKDSDEM